MNQRQLELLQEGAKRGILPERKQALYDEAVRRGLFKTSNNSLALGAGDVVEGAGSVLDLTVNPVLNGINQLAGGDPNYFSAKKLREATGLPSPETDDEKFRSAINRGLASAMTTVGAGVAGTAARPIGSASRAVFQSLAEAPGTQILADVGANTAQEKVRQAGGGEDLQLVAGLTGSLAGGGIPLAWEGAKAGFRGIKSTLDAFTPRGRERIAAHTLQEVGGPGINARIAEVAEEPELVPGSSPTLAQATGNSGLAIMEKGLASSDPRIGREFADRYADQKQARQEALSEVFEPATERLAVENKAVQAEAENLPSFLTAINDDHAEDFGATIRGAYQREYGDMKQKVRQAYEGIDPEGTTAFDVSPVYKQGLASLTKYFGPGAGRPNAETVGVLRELEQMVREGQTVPFRMLQNMRSRMSELAYKASMAGERRDAAVANELKQYIDKYVTEIVPHQGMAPEQAQTYLEANALRREQGQRFESGANRPMSRPGKEANGEALADSVVPALYFKAGDKGFDAAKDFQRAIGENQAAMEAIEDFAIQKLRLFATRPDGNIDVTKWNKWMNDHSGALRVFKDLRSRLNSVSRAQTAVDTMEQGLQAAGKRKQDWSWELTKRPLDDQFAQELTDSGMFTPEHVDSMRKVQQDINRALEATRLAATPGSDTARNLSTAYVISRLMGGDPQPYGQPSGLIKNVTKALWEGATALIPQAATIKGFAASDEMIRNILAEAMLDPKYAQDLMNRATPRRVESVTKHVVEIMKGMAASSIRTSFSDKSEERKER